MNGTWILPKQLHTLDCVRDMGALNLDCVESSEICGRLLFVRSKPSQSRIWLRKWKRDNWTRHLFGRILRPSHTQHFTDEWTSSLEDTHASHSQPQESDLEATTRGIFGRLLQMAFDFSNPSAVSLKTSKDISAWGCPTSSKTWQEWVIERRGAYSQRLNAERLTNASGCSSWPTVTTAEAGKISNRRNYGQTGLSNHPAIRGELNREKSKKDRAGQPKQWPTPDTCSRGDGPSQLERHTPTLQTEVKQWATPSSREWKGHTITDKFPNGYNITLSNQIIPSGPAVPVSSSTLGSLPESWATPRAGKTTDENPETWAKRQAKGDVATMPLTAQVKTWQTATVSTGAHRQKNGSMIDKLDRQVNGKLNPRWVETLMGLPVGWIMPSCASPVTIELTNCGFSGTELFRQPPSEHSEL